VDPSEAIGEKAQAKDLLKRAEGGEAGDTGSFADANSCSDNDHRGGMGGGKGKTPMVEREGELRKAATWTKEGRGPVCY